MGIQTIAGCGFLLLQPMGLREIVSLATEQSTIDNKGAAIWP